MVDFTQELKNVLLPLIAAEKTHPKELYPIGIGKVQETRFFDLHNNTFEGWFVDVQYYDGLWLTSEAGTLIMIGLLRRYDKQA